MVKKQIKKKKRISPSQVKTKRKQSLFKKNKARKRSDVLRFSKKRKKIVKLQKKNKSKKVVKKKQRNKLVIKKNKPKKTTRRKQKNKPVIIDATIHKTKIRVIGLGGGGSTIVSEIASRIKRADFYVANTDSQALAKSAKGIKKFQFGQNLTNGLGTGMNAEIGEMAAQEEEEKIKKLLESQDLCIIIASLGGGTSSGAGPIFAKISKNLGNITYGIFTLPFEFEGEKKMEMALSALEKIKPSLNVYTVIPNERIFNIIDKNTPLNDALSAINKRLADNLEGLIEMIYLSGLINIDFADLRTILSGHGRLTYLNTINIEGPNKEDAIKKLISSPLYPYSIKGSKSILYNIIGGNNIQLSEVHQISNVISELVSKNAKIIFGINQNSKYQDKTKITLLAAGCVAKGFLELSEKTTNKPKLQKKIKKEDENLLRPAGMRHITKKTKIKAEKKKTEEKKASSSKSKNKDSISEKIEKPVVAPPKKKRENKKNVKKSQLVVKKEIQSKKIVLKTKKSKLVEIKKKTQVSVPNSSLAISEKAEVIEKTLLNTDKFDKFKDSSPRQFIGSESDRGVKIRKNALQVRKEIEEAEKEIAEQEKVWEIPAILRRNKE